MAYTPFGDNRSSSSLTFEEFVPPSAWTEDPTCHYLLVDLPSFKRQELKLRVDNQTHLVVRGERQVRHNKYKWFEQSFELPKNADIVKITGKLDGEVLYITVPKKVEQEHEDIKHGSIHGGKKVEQEQEEIKHGSVHGGKKVEKEHEEIKHGSIHGGDTEVFDPAPSPVSDEDNNENEDKSDAYKNENENSSDTFYANDNKYGERDLERKKKRRGSDEADLFLRLAIKKLRKNKGIVVTAIFAFSLGVLVTQKLQSSGQ